MAKGRGSGGISLLKQDSRKREWYATEGGRWVQLNVYVMNLGRAIVESIGFPSIGTVEKNS